jgi:hypothetical protein
MSITSAIKTQVFLAVPKAIAMKLLRGVDLLLIVGNKNEIQVADTLCVASWFQRCERSK